MFKKIFDRIGSKTNPAKHRRTRAAVLLHYLEVNHSLILNREGLEKIGMNRKQAFQTVYDLVLHESIQMRAEADGMVVVMSNEEFLRQMETRAKKTWEKESALVLNEGKDAFDFDLAFAHAEESDPDFSSEERQTLPDRRREPWFAFEKSSQEID